MKVKNEILNTVIYYYKNLVKESEGKRLLVDQVLDGK
jgi:hypothetical protein